MIFTHKKINPIDKSRRIFKEFSFFKKHTEIIHDGEEINTTWIILQNIFILKECNRVWIANEKIYKYRWDNIRICSSNVNDSTLESLNSMLNSKNADDYNFATEVIRGRKVIGK